MSLALPCEAKALQVLGTGVPSVPAALPAGLRVPGAQAALRRATRSAPFLQLSGLVPSGEVTGVQTASAALLLSL